MKNRDPVQGLEQWELDELRDALARAEYRLLTEGYRENCDIPACNCGNIWAHGGHANQRLREISDALEGRDNGKTILQAVQELVEKDDQ